MLWSNTILYRCQTEFTQSTETPTQIFNGKKLNAFLAH